MESLGENRSLLYSLVGTASFIVLLVLGWVPELCEQFGVIDFPDEVWVRRSWRCYVTHNNKTFLYCSSGCCS